MKCPIVSINANKLIREDFNHKLDLLAIKLPGRFTQPVHEILCKRNMVFKMPHVKSILNSPNDPKDRIILLDPEYSDPIQVRSRLDFFSDYQVEIISHSLTIGYDHWSVDDILRSILPRDIKVISSFETIGHIAHLNLEPEHMPFKSIIGQVILDKNPNIKTVVTKTSEIKDIFRVFPMDIIAGENHLDVHIKQNGCIFHFDYGKTYWNSRLENEHARLVQIFDKNEKVCDVFSGVGPFSIPAAKKGCQVYANDLNPCSYDALLTNKKLNHISDDYLKVFNMDGGEFIRNSFLMLNSSSPDVSFFDHYIMNLPALAPQFLKYFNGLTNVMPKKLPLIHCYLFSKDGIDPLKIINDAFSIDDHYEDIDIDHVKCHLVRKVAPNKEMYCVSFKLPLKLTTGKRSRIE